MLRWLRDKWKQDLVTLRKRREKERRDRKILCPRCGYDVKGLPDRPCSECGLYVDSAWSKGRFAAGSPLRRSLALSLGIIAGHSMLRPAVALFAGVMLTDSVSWLPPDLRVRYWALGVALVAYLLACAGVLTVAIVRRRWLAYGPRGYAIRTTATLAVILFGTMLVAHLSLQAWVRTDFQAFAQLPTAR